MNNKKILDYLVVAIAMTTFSLQSACENPVSSTNIVSNEIYSLNVSKEKGASIELTINNKNNKASFSTKDNKDGSASSNIGAVRSYKIYLVRSSFSVYPSGGDPIKDSVSELTVNVGASPTHKIKLNNVPPSTYLFGTGEYYHIAIRAFSGANATGNELIKNNNGSSTPWSGLSYSTPKIAVSTGTGIQVVHKTFAASSSSSLSLPVNLDSEVGAELDIKVDVTLGSSSVLTPSSSVKSNVRVFTIAGVPMQSGMLRTSAYVKSPDKLAKDSSGRLYFTDPNLNMVFRINADNTMTIVAGNTFASSVPKYGDGQVGTKATLRNPSDIFIDSSNNLYIAEPDDATVRKIDPNSGIITTVVGSGSTGFSGDGGPATDAMLSSIESVVLDSTGNMYVLDKNNFRVRKIDLSGKISTFVGKSGFCDSGTCGDGEVYTSTNVALGSNLASLAIDSSDNLYILNKTGGRLRKIDATTGIITTIAGPTLPNNCSNPTSTTNPCGDNGQATNATFINPDHVYIPNNGFIYITDSGSFRIRRIEISSGIITTILGNGSSGKAGTLTSSAASTSASIKTYDPTASKPTSGSVILDSVGNLYIADRFNARVAILNSSSNPTTTPVSALTNPNRIASYVDINNSNRGDNGPATRAYLTYPTSMAKGRDGYLYFSDRKANVIRRINEATGVIERYSGTYYSGILPVAGDGLDYDALGGQVIYADPHHILLDNIGNMYITDRAHNRVRKITKSTKKLSTIVGTGVNCVIPPCGDGGQASLAELNLPTYLALDKLGNLYISDRDNHAIRKVDVNTKVITTIAGTITVKCPSSTSSCGDGGQATDAKLNQPYSIKFDSQGDLIIADRSNFKVRKVNMTTGIITTIAGTGVQCTSGNNCGDGGDATNAMLIEPVSADIDSAGNIYILDKKDFKIRKIDSNTNKISTIFGNGFQGIGINGELASDSRIFECYGLFIDPDDNIYIGDSENNLIRVIK